MTFFYLAVPLSPHDNALQVTCSLPGGERLFQTISLYDDITKLEERAVLEFSSPSGDESVRHRLNRFHGEELADA